VVADGVKEVVSHLTDEALRLSCTAL